MSSKPPRPKSNPIRHRITDIELIPTTSNRKISAKVLVDNEVICELPWIKSGQLLRWTRLIIHDGSGVSDVALEVLEKHSIKDRRFRSDAYTLLSAQQQTEITVAFVGTAWSATFKLLTPAVAEQSFAAALEKLRELKNKPSTLGRLGKARPVFEAMLQFGSDVSEVFPAAKVVCMVCTKSWEKLEAQEQRDNNLRELLDGLRGIVDFVELIKKHARTERLQGTIKEFLTLIEDVSIYAGQSAESGNSPIWSLRGVLDSREHDTAEELKNRFERLRTELILGVGAETHKQVYKMDLHGLLSLLHPVNPSGYDPSRACQEGTREGVISNIVSWTQQSTAPECILWVHGQAGIGKSSIATSACRQLANEKVLAASFFCRRDDPSLRDPLRLINSIAHGLATQYPPYGEAIAAAIEENRELCTAHMDIRYEGLIRKPLQSLDDALMRRPLIILIDALDECGSNDTRRSLLKHLLEMSKLVPWLKLIMTSRPDGDIQEFFQGSNKGYVSLRNVHSFDAADDIRAYMHQELDDIARRHCWDEGAIDRLCEKAEGVFIWAATVKNYLTGLRGSTTQRLRKVLDDQQSTVSDRLDILYRSVILAGMRGEEDDEKALFRRCIGAIVIASTRQPLSVSSLGLLLQGHLDPTELTEVVSSLDAVLHVDEHSDGAVRFYHPSFADYATDPSRSADLYVSPSERNAELAHACLKTMECELRFNICELETSYLLNTEVPDLAERIKSNISIPLSYACTYWISHLIDTSQGTLVDELDRLLNSPRVLYWLEVLSLLGRVEIGLQGLLQLYDWLPSRAVDSLEFVEDMSRFVAAFYDPISSSAPHIYVSALALAPRSALVIRRFGDLFPNTVAVTRGGDISWPRWLGNMPHPGEVTSVAVSPDGRLVASGCTDKAVRIWNIRSGTLVGQPLLGHLGYVKCVAWSYDGSRIVSGSGDKTLRLWDGKTCASASEPLFGHSDAITSVAFSPHDTLIASGSLDMTIRLWDAKTGAPVGGPLVGHLNIVMSVAFSPDGKYIISSSADLTLRVWDISTNPVIGKLLLEGVGVDCAAFSPDNSCIAFDAGAGLGIVGWSANNGTLVGEPIIHQSFQVSCLAFSPDGRRIVAGSDHKTIEVWNIEHTRDNVTTEQLIGHLGGLSSVAFLPDSRHMVSGSPDKTLRLWDTQPRLGIPINEPVIGHSKRVNYVAFTPDGSRVASCSDDKTIHLWDTKTGTAVCEPLTRHTCDVTYVEFTPDGKHLISGSFDRTLRLWDAKSGAPIVGPLIEHPDIGRCMALSPDGMHFAVGSADRMHVVDSAGLLSDRHSTISDAEMIDLIWTIKPSDVSHDEILGLNIVTSLVYSHDGALIASSFLNKIIRLWDAKTGAEVGNALVGHSGAIHSVAFSPDGKHLVSGSADKTVRLWDTTVGKTIAEPLIGHSSTVTCVTFSPDGDRIASCSYDKTVRLWDSHTGAALGEPLIGHESSVLYVAFSPDSSRICSGSRDGTVRMWDAKAGERPGKSDTIDPNHSQHQTPLPCNGWPLNTSALAPHPEHRSWTSLDGHSLLLWLTGHYRRAYSPATLWATSSKSIIELDFSKFAHGSSWASVACDKVRQNLV